MTKLKNRLQEIKVGLPGGNRKEYHLYMITCRESQRQMDSYRIKEEVKTS